MKDIKPLDLGKAGDGAPGGVACLSPAYDVGPQRQMW